MYLLRVALLLALLGLEVKMVYGDSVKTFEFGKEVTEEVTVCLDQETALSVMDAFATYGNAAPEKKKEAGIGALSLLDAYATLGVCLDLPVVITYTGTVKETDTKDGHHLGVFEATVRGYQKKVWVPLIGYTPLKA